MVESKCSKMRSTCVDWSGLRPITTEAEAIVEDRLAYVARVTERLPNFPASVILQLFYDHPQRLEDFAPLGFENLCFKLVELQPNVLASTSLRGHETVVQYSSYAKQGRFTDSPRYSRLLDYIQEHLTWPVPPVLVDNRAGQFPKLPGSPSWSSPYDLLEGHHRLAFVYALGLHAKPGHTAWLVSKEPS